MGARTLLSVVRVRSGQRLERGLQYPRAGSEESRDGLSRINACGDCAPNGNRIDSCKVRRGNRKPHPQGASGERRDRVGWGGSHWLCCWLPHRRSKGYHWLRCCPRRQRLQIGSESAVIVDPCNVRAPAPDGAVIVCHDVRGPTTTRVRARRLARTGSLATSCERLVHETVPHDGESVTLAQLTAPPKALYWYWRRGARVLDDDQRNTVRGVP